MKKETTHHPHKFMVSHQNFNIGHLQSAQSVPTEASTKSIKKAGNSDIKRAIVNTSGQQARDAWTGQSKRDFSL